MSTMANNFHILFDGDDAHKQTSMSSTALIGRWKKLNQVVQGETKGGEPPISHIPEGETEEEKAKREQKEKEEREEREKREKERRDRIEQMTADNLSLGEIRKTIDLSVKSFFCLSDRSHLVEDDTTLEHYIALTAQSATQPKGSLDIGAGESQPIAPKKTESSRITQVTIWYTNRKTRSRNERKEALAKQLAMAEEHNKSLEYTDSGMKAKFGERSSLYTEDLLKSSDYATTADSTEFSHPEQMTGADWDNVMRANRLLHGIYINSASVDVRRGRKPIFGKKGVQQNANKSGSSKDQDQSLYTETPSFSICDNSNISVDESATEHKTSLLEFGFNGGSAEASVSGGGPFTTISGSVSASGYKAERHQEEHEDVTKNITISYKFPRVELYLDELDQEGWELTRECKEALKHIKTSKSPDALYNFYERFGQFFAVTVRLGGRLTSTHHIEKVGEQNLSETKNRLKAAAALSISGPALAMSAKGSYEHQGEENNGGSTASNTDSLAWQATGGDTTLASNPASWAPTVRNYHNWRVTEINKVVPITQVLDTKGSTEYHDLFHDIEINSLISIGETRFDMQYVALIQDMQCTLSIYYQDSDGMIWECTTDSANPETKNHNKVAKARHNSPLVALNNPYDDYKNYIRLIFVNPDGHLDEMIYDTPKKCYTPGHLGKLNIKLPQGNHIAGTSWGNGNKAEVRLFYQNEQNSLCLITCRPNESQGLWYSNSFPLVRGIVPKTPLAAGLEQGPSERVPEIPFILFLRADSGESEDQHPLYIVREDRRFDNYWYAKKVPNQRFSIEERFSVPNALRRNPLSKLYSLRQDRTSGRGVSVYGANDSKPLPKQPGSPLSIAAAQDKSGSIFVLLSYTDNEGKLHKDLATEDLKTIIGLINMEN